MFATASLLAALLPAAALGASTGPADSVAPVASSPGERPVDPVARGVVVKTRATDATVRRATQRAAGPDVEVLAPDSLTGALTTVDFAATVSLEDAADVAADLAARADVEWAVPNGRRTTAVASPVTPNDPSFAKQVQLWDAAAPSPGGFGTKAPTIWPRTTGQKDVVVAVLDTGVRTGHPDLKNRLVAGYDMIGADQDEYGNPLSSRDPYRFYTANDKNGRDKDPSDPGDWIPKGDRYCYGERTRSLEPSSWHGTHVAGIIAAQQGNKTGISGVAPDARVQPVRVLGRCGGWDSDILAGIVWASGGAVAGVPANRTPADVVNLSLGSSLEGLDDAQELRELYCDAYGSVAGDAQDRGALVVAAAGNEWGDADLAVPASCPGYLSVAGTNRAGQAAWYTNTGAEVDIAAYGGDQQYESTGVLSTVDAGTTKPSRSTYAAYQGTSMAAPAVSGAAALLLSAGVDPVDLEEVLLASTQAFGPSSPQTVPMPDGTEILRNCTVGTCGSGVLDLSTVRLARSAPTVTGLPVVGATLSTDGGTWTGGDDGIALQWQRDGQDVEGATADTYELTEADLGARIGVAAVPTTAGLGSQRRQSQPTQPVGVHVSLAVDGPAVYGAPQTYTVGAADGDGALAGRDVELVAVRDGADAVLGAATTDSTGSAVITLPSRSLDAGDHAVVARVVEAGTTWQSAVSVQRIAKATSRTAVSVASTVKASRQAVLTLTVSAPGVDEPVGQVKVYDGSKVVRTLVLAAEDRGTTQVTLPKLKKGKHRIAVVYVGNTNVAGSRSTTRTVTSR